MQSRPSGTTVESGESGNILAFRVSAALSAMAVERVDVELTDRPWLFLTDVELRDGSITVARTSVTENSFVYLGDDKYRLSFTGFNISVAKDKSKVLTVRVTAKEDLLFQEPRQFTVSIPQGSIRTRDQIGVTHSGPAASQAPSFSKTFFIKRAD
jgi:hypothetical protein